MWRLNVEVPKTSAGSGWDAGRSDSLSIGLDKN